MMRPIVQAAAALFLLPLSAGAAGKPPLKVFILAGDHNALEQAPMNGASLGVEASYYAHAEPVAGERKNHVNCLVYHARWDVEVDFVLVRG